MATIIFNVGFVNNASPQVVLTSTELTGAAAPTINISSTLIADGTTIASVVSGGAMTYDTYTSTWSYRLAVADLATYVYKAKATTTYATASPASVQVLGIVIPDELISSRHPSGAAVAKSPATLAAADVSGNLPADLQTIKTQAVTAAAPVTFPASIGTSTLAAGALMDLVNAPNATAVTALQNGLATAANQTTILARLGAWTGSARNTLLGALQALFRNDADATVPSDINANLGAGAGTADNTTDSVQALRGVADAIKSKTDNIGVATVTVVSPVSTNGDADVDRGYDYYAIDGRALSWTDTGETWPDLTGATALFVVDGLISTPATITTPAGPATLTVELSKVQTALLPVGARPFHIDVTLANTHLILQVRGDLTAT